MKDDGGSADLVERMMQGIPVQMDKTNIMLFTPNMTLRDYYAGQALPGLVDMPPEAAARKAYLIADAMLAERGKSQ